MNSVKNLEMICQAQNIINVKRLENDTKVLSKEGIFKKIVEK